MVAIWGLVLALGSALPRGAAAGAFAEDGPTGLGGAAAADSLRTNLWLVEALMGEIVAEGLGVAQVRGIEHVVAEGDEGGGAAAADAVDHALRASCCRARRRRPTCRAS